MVENSQSIHLRPLRAPSRAMAPSWAQQEKRGATLEALALKQSRRSDAFELVGGGRWGASPAAAIENLSWAAVEHFSNRSPTYTSPPALNAAR